MTESNEQPVGMPVKWRIILLGMLCVTAAIGIYSVAAPTAFSRWMGDVCHHLPIVCWNEHRDYSYLYALGKGTYALGFRALRIVCDWLLLVWFGAWLIYLFGRQRYAPMELFSAGKLTLFILFAVGSLAWLLLSADFFGAADGHLNRRSQPGLFGTAIYLIGVMFGTGWLAIVVVQAIRRWDRYVASRRKPS